ncbi:sigma-70 family RNA polymerase sigma factor [Streptomyces thermolineatus]|uniref:sigma-70 family RNA polymerase sigma factor n=1 Tax=Streptomyces thermolineatus TaxID=44033 RepID=UPI0031E13EC0
MALGAEERGEPPAADADGGGDPGTDGRPSAPVRIPRQRGPGAVSPALPAGDGGALPAGDGGALPAGGGGTADLPGDLSGTGGPPSDTELVRRVRGGDDSAYEELYRRHADAVRRYAHTCCRDPHTAEDLTGEVFARTLQAVRAGSGPDSAVRAYLMTVVRRVAASWGRTARKEQLVEDFAVFAATSTGRALTPGEASATDGVPSPGGGPWPPAGPGADVRAMLEAERSMAVQAFRSLPERWQAVLWHTAVEQESPSEVAPLLGLTANATAVLAHRAREGLRQAYLQAHVNASLTAQESCGRHADRLGAYARGALGLRAGRDLRRHLDGCGRCRAAYVELADVNACLRAVLPVAVIGWAAASYAVKAAGAAGAVGAAGVMGAGAVGAGGVGAAAGGGAMAGSGAVAGGSAVAGSSAVVVAEGIALPLKIGLGMAAAAAAGGIAYGLAERGSPVPAPRTGPPLSAPAAPRPPSERAGGGEGAGGSAAPGLPSVPAPPGPGFRPPLTASPGRTPTTAPASASSSARLPGTVRAGAGARPSLADTGAAPAETSASPTATGPLASSGPPAPGPGVYPLDELLRDGAGAEDADGAGPSVRPGEDGGGVPRRDPSVGGTRYGRGVSVRAPSSIVIDLGRACSAYGGSVGMDDLSEQGGAARFSVYADGVRLWRSGLVKDGEAAVAFRVPLAGRETVRLVVDRNNSPHVSALADWVDTSIECG